MGTDAVSPLRQRIEGMSARKLNPHTHETQAILRVTRSCRR
jgi:hypothetical protein